MDERHVQLTVWTRSSNSGLTPSTPSGKDHVMVVFGDESEDQQKAQELLNKLYNWDVGFHYDKVDCKTIKTIKQMAKKATTTEETGVAVFEESVKKVLLPEIPKVMNIGGVEFSEESIKAAVDAVKEIKVEIIKDDDTVEVANAKQKVYDDLKAKKNQFVKTRTSPDNFRKEVTKPLTDWSRDLKKQTDAYGDLAKAGELHCTEQIEIWDNYEAEQQRLKEEAEQAIVKARTIELHKVNGVLNPESLHWTFPYNPAKIVENIFLVEADDSEWNGLMKELEDSLSAHQAKEKAEAAEAEANKTLIVTTRVQMLQMMQYEESGENYTKNGHVLTPHAIATTSADDWMALIMSHNTPAVAPSNPFAVPPISAPAAPVETASPVTNPFAAFETPVVAEEPEEDKPFHMVAPVVEEVDERTLTVWDKPYVEKMLGNTQIRIFHVDNQAEAVKGIGEIRFDGSFDNGIMFLIHKPNA